MINAMKGHLAEIGFEKPRTVSKMEDQVFCACRHSILHSTALLIVTTCRRFLINVLGEDVGRK